MAERGGEQTPTELLDGIIAGATRLKGASSDALEEMISDLSEIDDVLAAVGDELELD